MASQAWRLGAGCTRIFLSLSCLAYRKDVFFLLQNNYINPKATVHVQSGIGGVDDTNPFELPMKVRPLAHLPLFDMACSPLDVQVL